MTVDTPADRVRPRAQPFRLLSIRQKAPLIAGVLIFLVGVSVSVASYFEVRHTAVLGAEQHVRDLLQLLGSTQRNGSQLYNAANAVAERPEIAQYLAAPNPSNAAAALTAMLERRGRGVVQLAGMELRDASGQVLLTTNAALSAVPSDYPPAIASRDSGSVGKLRLIHDSIVYPVAARVPGPSGAYLVEWRHATTSAAQLRETQRLIGHDVVLLMGNIDGSLWTDQTRVVRGPTVDTARAPGELFQFVRTPSEGPIITGTVPMARTPLVVAVEFPLHGVLLPADHFLRVIMLITLVCIAVGVFAAWALARRITLPLQHLTEAADAIAAGRDTAELPVDRSDELGQLAAAFDTMAQEIRDARQRLEDKVRDRTGELNQALRQLEDAQAALVRREKLATLGQLAGGVGHELRNPLGVMSNAIYYLDMVLQTSPDDVRDYLRLLRQQVTLSSKIVSDLLDMARVTPPQRRITSLREIVDAQLARITLPATVQLSVNLDPATPSVDVDPVQIGQVVFNLLTNALQAMGDAGGTLTLTGSGNQDDVRLAVADSGSGIAAEHLDKIFEPLFTTKARGIGLGLAVSRALAQGNDGNIEVASEPGRGAVFTVTVPAAAAVPA